MNRSLIPILLVVASTQTYALSITDLPTISALEPSTISLLAAGIVALSIARHRAAK